jgi:hypothetical protein
MTRLPLRSPKVEHARGAAERHGPEAGRIVEALYLDIE